jgi:hypothetical protein
MKPEIEIKENYKVNAIIDELRKFQYAKIVIIFIMSQYVPSVTTVLNGMQYGEFLLIGSEAWGYRPGDFKWRPYFLLVRILIRKS